MGKLTTHVLDSSRGCPGDSIHVQLFHLGNDRILLSETFTNQDGRCNRPLLEGESFMAGTYELVFAIGEYYRQTGVALPDPAFLEDVVIRFGIADENQHYHVPLLVSPYSYSTYRGS